MKTSTAIAGRNLYITTKGLVLLHQGICYCHTVQPPSSCNCCISMRSCMHCKTTRILAVGFLIRSYCFTQRNQNLHPYNFLRCVFARGVKEHTSHLCVLLDIAKCTFGQLCYIGRSLRDGKEEGSWGSSLPLQLRVSGSEAHSQNTHAEQAE